MNNPLHPRARRAFSLVELLVVISIIGVVATFAVPAISTMVKGSALTQASQELTGQIAAARQYATSKNHSVEVRFLKFGNQETPGEDPANPATGKFRAIQLMEVLDSGVLVPFDKMRIFPQAVIMNETSLSSLLDDQYDPNQKAKDPIENVDPALPRGVGYKYKYVSFRFLPNGSTTLTVNKPGKTTRLNWYITLHNIKDQGLSTGAPPANFFTLQIDPVSGTTRIYRPGVG